MPVNQEHQLYCTSLYLTYCEQGMHKKIKVKVKLSYKSWRLRGEWNVGLSSLLWHSAQLRWQSCQLYTQAAVHLREIPWYSFLLEAEWTPPQAYWMLTEEFGHLKMYQDPTTNRTRDPPSYGALSQPTAPPLIPSIKRYLYLTLWGRSYFVLQVYMTWSY
jgi:hypothetical protein